MGKSNGLQAKVISFPESVKRGERPRKSGLNRNKEGSVRKINGKVYVDFMYLGERVREPAGLPWNEQNARRAREQLDRIVVAIESGTFRFHTVFQNSKRLNYFSEKERLLNGLRKSPDQVLFKDFVWTWYNSLQDSGRVSERTLLGYKSNINLYLVRFFGDVTFADMNINTFEKFISWAKRQCYKDKAVGNETINKCFVPLKTICKSVAIEHGWGDTYNPFFGFKKLPEGDPYEKILPFSLEEQNRLIVNMPYHWRPYFLFAFCSGLRQGEQIGLKAEDIDWSRQLLHIRRAITLDRNGKRCEGRTKNRYSRRTIKLTSVMLDVLKKQKEIYDQFSGKYFFCSPIGKPVHPSNLRRRVWIPALRKADLEYREMKQTRHTFATIALSCGENPLWIAKVMGHRDTNMIIKVYSKYVENINGSEDGARLDNIYKGMKVSEKER